MGGKRRDILFKVIVPAAMGSMLTGLRIAVRWKAGVSIGRKVLR